MPVFRALLCCVLAGSSHAETVPSASEPAPINSAQIDPPSSPDLPQTSVELPGASDIAQAEKPKVEFLWELDAYYSSAAVTFPLSDKPVPDGGGMRERDVYATLFRNSLRPRLLMLEASVYPLPALGAWLRGNRPDTYKDFVVGEFHGDELNVIEGLTAGYQEPWAVSAFLGSEMTFTREGDRQRMQNRGYMGYLVSFGTKHLRSNYLIDDNWWEFEWKLKGEREFREEELSWSFRIGTKEHANPDIRDVVYVGIHRDNLDFSGPIFSVLRNSSIELKTEAARDNLEFLRQEIIFGKKFPIRRWHIAGQLDFGVIFEDRSKYSGVLAQQDVDDFTIVLQPNIDW